LYKQEDKYPDQVEADTEEEEEEEGRESAPALV
jgi:hypothetical protein